MKQVSITVDCVYADAVKQERVELMIPSDAVPVLRRKKGETMEMALRRNLDVLGGEQKKVLNDVYRHLVRGNYTLYEGEQGYAADKSMEKAYPDNGTLPDVELKTGRHNSAGQIVHNLLRHQQRDTPGYRILGEILVGLLDAKVLAGPPRVDRRPDTVAQYAARRRTSQA